MNPRHKILILGKLPPPFMGPAIATQILLDSGLKNNFRLLHLNTQVNESLADIGKWSVMKIFKNAGIYLRLLKICIREKPALVLIPISQSTVGFAKDFFFILISKLCGRKVLLQLRGSNFKNWKDNASLLTKGMVSIAMKCAAGMIVQGNNLKHLFHEYFPDNKIFVIPNGGDFYFPALARDPGKVRFLYLSNLFAAKGIPDVIDAVNILNKTHGGKFHLDVAGSWLGEKEKKYCLEMIENNQLPVSVYPSLTGAEKLGRFAVAEAFVFPPREPEGHPWVIVEAMAAGLPVIATDKGAIAESVIDGENGFIVREKSPEDLAAKMEKLLTDAGLRKRMSVKSLELYKEKFTAERMVENYTKCFNELLEFS